MVIIVGIEHGDTKGMKQHNIFKQNTTGLHSVFLLLDWLSYQG